MSFLIGRLISFHIIWMFCILKRICLKIVIYVKGKTNDNIKAIMNAPLFFHHKNIELVYDGLQGAKPNANFILDNNA
jgi:hypothetical protein